MAGALAEIYPWIAENPHIEQVQKAAIEVVEQLKYHDEKPDHDYEHLVGLMLEMFKLIDQFDESKVN